MSTLSQQKIADIIGFEETVVLGLQQEQSLLSPRVQTKSYHGDKIANLQVFSPTEVYKVDSDVTLPETRYNATKQERRWISFETATWAEVVNPFIHLRQSIDPFISYAKSAIFAFKRYQDSVIMEGMLGKNMTGRDGGTPEYFPKSNVLRLPPISATASAKTALKDTLAGLILDGIVWLAEKGVDIDRERIILAVPPTVYRGLFDIEEVVNRDYVGQANLDAGRVRHLAGVEILLYKKVLGDPQFPKHITIDGTDTEKNYYCPMWCASSVQFGMWESLNTTYDRLPTHNNAQQILVEASMGASRLEPNKIVCLEVPKSTETIARIKEEASKATAPVHKTLSEVARAK
ncbi:phage capsid protein [Candidatus Liberibacter asiaticus]|uniref:phage capsid protein n=1 Tax=Liberibacter asiaticus TaxID=34021 RepID=UPI00405A0777